MDYLRRVEATLTTKDAFLGKSLKWGKTDCLQLAAFCLRQLGHKNPTKGVRKYSSRLGAVRALQASGYANLAEAVDGYGLTRIPPAQAMAGDIVAYASETFGGYALGIAIGDNRMIGYAPEEVGGDVGIAEIWAASIAWRAV